jgi:serine/threonine protein kinase/tetratricopeptide (TPR) repeat protein
MGEVYRAVDRRLGRAVAIKILTERLTENRHATARFEREARAVAALTHPNILSIYEFEVDGPTPFVVTELLEGQTLRERMASRIPWKKAAEIGAAIADGLAAAHARGITHRDLKPENVFLTSDGRVKILDFGIAHMREGGGDGLRFLSDTEPTAEFRANAPLGTVGYVAPEQIRMEEPAPTSDLFAMGVILHEMIGGANPFARASSMETLAAILDEEPVPLRHAAADVPVAVDHIVHRCLEKNPEERFQSARDLAAQLREAARQAEPPYDAIARRRRRLSAGAAALVTLMSFAAFLLLTEMRVVDLLGTGAAPPASVAVLPFVNAAGPELEYLSDGLTEALINRLSELPDLRVISRTTAFAHKGSPRDPVEIGRDFGVSAIITGRLAAQADRLVLQVDVVETRTRTQLWGHIFEQRRDQMSRLPGEVAGRIAKELRFELTGAQQAQVAQAATASEGAYDLYLRGLQELAATTRQAREKAIFYFEKAVEADPQFASAHAILGETYLRRSVNTDPKLMREKARRSIARALEIDPLLAEGHQALGLLRYWDDWDLDAADAAFRRALELNPNLAAARGYRAHLLLYRGQFDAAIEQARRARQLDPLSRTNSVILIDTYLFSGRLEEARQELARLLATAPDYPSAHYLMARLEALVGNDEAACSEFVRSRELAEVDPADVAALREGCAMGGLDGYRRALIGVLQKRELEVVAPEIAGAYAELGELETAYEYLQIAYDARSPVIISMGIDPAFEPLRDDPRVLAMLERAGLSGKIGMSRPVEARVAPGGR